MNALGFPSYQLQNPTNGATISFNSGQPDINGCYWWLDGSVEGWESAPDGRVTMLPRVGNDPAADGETAADLHYKGRTIAMTLFAECPSEAAREASRYLLDEVLDLINAPGWFFANESTPLQASVLRTGNIGQGKSTLTDQGFPIKVSETQTATLLGGLGGLPTGQVAYVFKAQIEVYAPDPRKYTQAVVAFSAPSGSVQLSNLGGNTLSQNAAIAIAVAGPGGLGPVVISVTGSGYSASMRLVVPTVPNGAPALAGFPATLLVDFYAKTITDAFGSNFYYLRDLTTPWLSFPPGALTIAIDQPSNVFTGRLSPAYI